MSAPRLLLPRVIRTRMGTCPECSTRFPLDTDHKGRPHAPRVYCSLDCRRLARNDRRAQRRRLDREWGPLVDQLTREQTTEPPLPGMPPLPLPPADVLERLRP